MADVDDEFLALVGGDDASDDEVDQDVSSDRNPSPSPSPDPDSKSTSKATPVVAKSSRRRRQDDSDEEEGEASSVAGSDDSAPMDESDSDAESLPATASAAAGGKVDDDTETKYRVDGIYLDNAEKEEIQAMPELEREQLLAKRQEEIDRSRQNALLRRLLEKSKQDDSQSAKKRKASSADIDDSQRKTSRQRTKIGGSRVGETSAGIESLRRARAEKSDRQRRRAEDRERHKGLSGIQDSPQRDDDVDSDVDWADTYRRRPSRSPTPEKRDAPPAELRDFERVRLSRSRFAEVCFYPGFEDAIAGCYARVAVGPNRDTGEPQYHMCVIKGFTTGKPYAMQKMNGQSFVTDQYVKVAHGKLVREFPFISCSDSPFTESEAYRYQRACQDDNIPFPKRPQVDAKIDDINALRNRTWTEREVNDKLARMSEMKKKYDSSERNRLLNKLEEAKDRGDDARAAELQSQLDKMEVPKLAFRTSLAPTKKPSSSAPSQQDRLAQVNAQRRRDNVEAVRKAQLMERARVRNIEARIARGEEVEEDTSRRLKTKPKFKQDVNEAAEMKNKSSNGSGASTPASSTPKVGPTSKTPLLPHLQKLQLQNHQNGKDKKGIPQIHRPLVADDIIASLDLDIDVEID
ncbi:hypothetical protein GGR57DRAFT_400180 [Xylariaceae sp. FL1272]|nr:hypothetical protein GGR57DRAFT_400180 [Xylariaceae sp. FL1272]